ncbi:cell envelope integrity inner membrane protein TolA [Cedecea neteri]|uniref:Cell envelope integrity inner membrane protein TolA n=1 Tax=Cedecea neteri TaxID=158822 RepID=A0A291E5Y2_9ENTR|nr:hypothetical protein CO704_25725 [Cedecea neteri]SQC92092.1 cell envelope integrity inner membrane protein TolA [Cedecea neteri]
MTRFGLRTLILSGCLSVAGCQHRTVTTPPPDAPIHFGDKYTGDNPNEYAGLLSRAIEQNFFDIDQWRGKTCTLRLNMEEKTVKYEHGNLELCRAAMGDVSGAVLPAPSEAVRKVFVHVALEFKP